jgi:hypothetical protein
MHLESLHLTLDSQPSKGDKWEGVCLAQEDVKKIKMSREIPKSWPPKNKVVRLNTAACTG